MAIQRIELIPPFIVPRDRLDAIAKGIAGGTYYGGTKTHVLNPGDSFGSKYDVANGVLVYEVKASLDGTTVCERSRLEDIQPGSNIALKHETTRQIIVKGSSPVCIYSPVSRDESRVRLHSVVHVV